MIAPFRPNADDINSASTEPRQIGEILNELLAGRGIDLSRERQSMRRTHGVQQVVKAVPFAKSQVAG